MTTVILKPTDACNASCRYCSAAQPGTAQVMTLDTLRSVFQLFGDWAVQYGQRRLNFIWHGGEPLLMPAAFWEAALQAQADLLLARGIQVGNGLQTNATRLTAATLPLVRRLVGEGGTVGTSADPIPGIRELQGAPEGRYAEAWEAAMGLLRGAGLRYGILHVVHRLSLPRLPEIYRWFRQRHPQAGLRFNPLYRQGRAGDAGVWGDLGITSAQWGAALGTLHQLWKEDGRPRNVQPFGPWWQVRQGGAWRLSCECSGQCGTSHFGVGPGGTVYLCGRSADGGTFAFGAAGGLTAQALQEHPARQLLANRRVYLKRTACRDCPGWLYCHGGCVNDSLLEGTTPFAPTSFCAGLRAYFEDVLAKDGEP